MDHSLPLSTTHSYDQFGLTGVLLIGVNRPIFAYVCSGMLSLNDSGSVMVSTFGMTRQGYSKERSNNSYEYDNVYHINSK